LFNAFRANASPLELKPGKLLYDAMLQSDKRLLEEADFLDPEHQLMEVVCDEGISYNSIMEIANEKKVDCIVVGREANGNNITDLLGSTATALTKNSNIPVIVVPEEIGFEKNQEKESLRATVSS
jgi:nucleotide-binding universal stress UspA family protein